MLLAWSIFIPFCRWVRHRILVRWKGSPITRRPAQIAVISCCRLRRRELQAPKWLICHSRGQPKWQPDSWPCKVLSTCLPVSRSLVLRPDPGLGPNSIIRSSACESIAHAVWTRIPVSWHIPRANVLPSRITKDIGLRNDSHVQFIPSIAFIAILLSKNATFEHAKCFAWIANAGGVPKRTGKCLCRKSKADREMELCLRLNALLSLTNLHLIP